MSKKLLDHKGRWRNKTVAFRMSEEESDMLNRLVKISGLTKQDYLTQKVLSDHIVVKGTVKLVKVLKESLNDVYLELSRISSFSDLNSEEWGYIEKLIDTLSKTINELEEK